MGSPLVGFWAIVTMRVPSAIRSSMAVTVTVWGVFQVAGVTVLGAMLFAAVVYRRIRRVATAGVTALGLLLVSGGIGYATFRPGARERAARLRE